MKKRTKKRSELQRYKDALYGHLCKYDAADWLACIPGSHRGPNGELYCEVCESSDKEHLHATLKRVEAERDLAVEKLATLVSVIRKLAKESTGEKAPKATSR